MKRHAYIFPIAIALFFMVLSFCIDVHANNENDFQLTIFSAEQQAIKREINSTQFEKDISLVLKFKVPSLNFNKGSGCSQKVVQMKEASIPVSVPLVIVVKNDLTNLNIYVKTVNISFKWEDDKVKIQEVNK